MMEWKRVASLGLAAALVAAGAYAGACGSGAACAKCKTGATGADAAACQAHKTPDATAQVAEQSTIGTTTLKALINSGTAPVILDARGGKYDDGRRIPGAQALAPGAAKEDIAEAVKSKDQLVVTYCSNLKCPASSKLAKNLRTLGYQNVLEYREGIEGWTAAGNAVTAANPQQ